MPYLNWKASLIGKRMEAPSGARATLTLELSSQERDQLVPFLEAVFLHGGSELRVDLPDQWAVFWKRREGESRLLLAHPQAQEWVATIALADHHGIEVVQRFKGFQSGDVLVVGDLGMIGPISNVEVILILK